MKLAVAIQHHPDRAELIPPLLDAIGMPAEVVIDPDPDHRLRSALRTYLRCLHQMPEEATNLLILQDDTELVPNFAERATELLAEKPDDLVALFVPGANPHRNVVLRAAATGAKWVMLPQAWQPVVALSWTREHRDGFLRYAERYDVNQQRGDDGPVGAYCREARIRVWAPVPSIVQHADRHISVVGRKHRAGGDRARVAALFDS